MRPIAMISSPRPPREFREFGSVLDTAFYEQLPNDWLVGVTDVVDSTSAVAAGRYKDVNYAGASLIAALGNGLGTFDFPFVFRGDGAAFALPPDYRLVATSVLQQVANYARARLGLKLRIGLLTVDDIRMSGRDVRIGRYAPSENASYAMFAGGGLKWAEQQIKEGRHVVDEAEAAGEPDLNGLTCDWAALASQEGEIVSLLVEPAQGTGHEVFATLVEDLLAIFDASPRHSHPVPDKMALPLREPPTLAGHSWSDVVANSDVRKYDDVLRLTLDCASQQVEAAQTLLLAAKARGIVNFGLHRQTHALMTCLVPAAQPHSHLHFLDGMDGGYTKAAEVMESASHRS